MDRKLTIVLSTKYRPMRLVYIAQMWLSSQLFSIFVTRLWSSDIVIFLNLLNLRLSYWSELWQIWWFDAGNGNYQTSNEIETFSFVKWHFSIKCVTTVTIKLCSILEVHQYSLRVLHIYALCGIEPVYLPLIYDFWMQNLK